MSELSKNCLNLTGDKVCAKTKKQEHRNPSFVVLV